MKKASMRTRLLFVLLLVGAAGLVPPPAAVSDFIYYVDFNSAATTDCTPTSTGCTGQCATPTCGSAGAPCHTIQAALNLANCNIGANTALEADVLVAAGTYPERIFVYPNTHLIGAGRDITTIDAKGLNRSAVIMSRQTQYGFNRPGVKFSISGFRIIHGDGDCMMLGSVHQIGGGGILLYGEIPASNGWPRVTDCRIEDNTLYKDSALCNSPTAYDWHGAGIYIAQGQPTISGNIIQRNMTAPPDRTGTFGALGLGGGIYALSTDAQPIITHNTVINNVAFAQQGKGGGIYLRAGAGTVVSNNLVVANSANIEGGGMMLYSDGASAYNNVVMGNIGGIEGGGISTHSPVVDVNVTNNTIVGNVLSSHTVPSGGLFTGVGGGIYAYSVSNQQSNPKTHITNNLMAQNDAQTTGSGGALFSNFAFATNDHSNFYGDRPDEIGGDYAAATVIGTNGNVSLNPVFASAPVFWDHTNAAGTATTTKVFNATRYAVGDRIEYNNDGVSRQITAINGSTKTLTFTPALTNKVCSNATNAACAVNGDCRTGGTCGTDVTRQHRILANWGSSTNVTEDLRLTASSPMRDAGTDTPLFGTVPATDYSDLSRPVDGDSNGSAITDIGAYEFRFPDSDGDGWPDSNDCAPLVNSVWTAPDQAPGPLAIDGSQNLSWLHIPQSNVYNVYSGTLTLPFTYNATCFQAEVAGSSASVAGTTPPLGSTYYYLVGGVNSCGSGPFHLIPTAYPSAACSPSGADTDGDGVQNVNDNCPTLSNANQADADLDTVGTACDNCPTVYNPSQLDANLNGVGDACE
jgi:hypothetical protein